MSCGSSVEQVLSAIGARNQDIIGCVVVTEQSIYNNLSGSAKAVDVDSIVNYTSNMFEISRALDRKVTPFNQLFLEYAGHSIYARRLDDGVLVLVNKPIERSSFKKMQVGVNLFMKPLLKALSGEGPASRPLIAEGPDFQPAI